MGWPLRRCPENGDPLGSIYYQSSLSTTSGFQGRSALSDVRLAGSWTHIVVVDSHVQRIVLATEETTMTQQVSHRPIKCQSRLWSIRGTKVDRSHHGDNPLLRPTGIQIATKCDATLQAMAPTNIKTVHQTSIFHIESNLDRLGLLRLPTTSVLSNKPDKLRSNQF